MKNQAKDEWELLFRVEETATDVVLFCDGGEIGRAQVEPSRELLEKILPAVERLLLEHGLVSNDIADVRVESDLPDGYSSRRIAETAAKVWNFAGKK